MRSCKRLRGQGLIKREVPTHIAYMRANSHEYKTRLSQTRRVPVRASPRHPFDPSLQTLAMAPKRKADGSGDEWDHDDAPPSSPERPISSAAPKKVCDCGKQWYSTAHRVVTLGSEDRHQKIRQRQGEGEEA